MNSFHEKISHFHKFQTKYLQLSSVLLTTVPCENSCEFMVFTKYQYTKYHNYQVSFRSSMFTVSQLCRYRIYTNLYWGNHACTYIQYLSTGLVQMWKYQSYRVSLKISMLQQIYWYIYRYVLNIQNSKCQSMTPELFVLSDFRLITELITDLHEKVEFTL